MIIKEADYSVYTKDGFQQMMFETLAKQVLFKNGVNLEEGMYSTLGKNGIQTLPSGLTFQWGTEYISPNQDRGITGRLFSFPQRYKKRVFPIIIVPSFNYSSTAAILTNFSEAFDARSLSGGGFRYRQDGDIVNNNDVFIHWIALGE